MSPRLRVGGPATAAAAWVADFLKYAAENHVPVDFVSTHGYADDTVEEYVRHRREDIPHGRPRLPRRREGARPDQASATPNLPLFWTEWNVQGDDAVARHHLCRPGAREHHPRVRRLVDMLSFWTFSDVFEEGGPIPEPFHGHFGLRA